MYRATKSKKEKAKTLRQVKADPVLIIDAIL